MLRVAGSLAQGTILWLSGPRYIRTAVVPEITAAAERAGRPPPRVVAGVPVCVTDDARTAFDRISVKLAGIGSRPVYRAVLETNGSTSPAEVALIGDEATVAEHLAEIHRAGTTDLAAQIVASSPEEYDRTFSFLASQSSTSRAAS